jgi:hypothetical protein
MFHRVSHLLIVLVCLALVIPALSCAGGQTPFDKRIELQLEKAPRLNEPVRLTCIRQTSSYVKPAKTVSDNVSPKKAVSDNTTYEKIILTFDRLDPKTRLVTRDIPLQEVLVGSSLNWEGYMTGEPMQFSATIKFPYEGCWRIIAKSTKNHEDSDMVAVQVAEDGSTFGCQKDYAPPVIPFPYIPDERQPVSMEFDIAKPPHLNEPFQITWGISTIRDIAEASAKVGFYRMEGTEEISVPAEEVLIKGDITWKGSLKKDSPLHFSATVKLPEEGGWSIGAEFRSYVEEEPITAGSGLYLHVDKDKSRWGWTESHESKPLNTPHPPIPPVPTPQGR